MSKPKKPYSPPAYKKYESISDLPEHLQKTAADLSASLVPKAEKSLSQLKEDSYHLKYVLENIEIADNLTRAHLETLFIRIEEQIREWKRQFAAS